MKRKGIWRSFPAALAASFLMLSASISAAQGNPLPIPPLLTNQSSDPAVARFELTVQKGETEFFPGKPNITLGYNGNLLGPTLRAKRGQRVEITVHNSLREYTTVHWHGMLLPGSEDGGPHQVVAPDSDWKARFTVDQPAATLWYHPHGIGNTATQVYFGLAGFFILDDEASEKLDIPREYGVDDIPLVVQDRRFSSAGVLLYNTTMRDIMYGMQGKTLLVNGAVNPYLMVPRAKVRLRLLNGSNAGFYDFSFEGNKKFHQIASDGGLLIRPVEMNHLSLSPGERGEIVMDFSGYGPGTVLYLRNGRLPALKIIVGKGKKESPPLPEVLAVVPPLPYTGTETVRRFTLSGLGRMVGINGRQMNLRRINEQVRLNSTEIWEITSRTGMMGMMGGGGNMLHNFHAHGIQFQVLARNGSMPPENERGWKDTVQVREGEVVQVITRFQYPGDFMYHCHVLEHEDNGMMGQFRVE